MENIGSMHCQTYGCDYFKAKGKNLRFVWPIVLAVVGVLLLFFLLGSALGCEACFECAEACGMEELEDCGRDCDEQTDACFTCEGVTCGERVGCFSCHGKWDCSTCGGKVIYTLTIVLDENNEESYSYEADDLKELEYLSPQYIPGQGPTYYKFLGYFDKKGKQYFDDTGARLRAVKGSMTLYADYEEKNFGETYQLEFNTQKTPEYGYGEWFPAPDGIPVVVGDYVSGMPGAPDVPGYTFKGWYNANGQRVVGPNEINEWEFHLYSVEHSPENPDKVVVLDAIYVQNEYEVTFHYTNGSTAKETVTYGTTLQSIWGEYDRSNNSEYYKFFGWADEATTDVENVLDPNKEIVITADMHLYEVSRDWVTLYFYYDKEGMNALTYEKKFYEGQTCVFSELKYRDATEGDFSSPLTLNEWVKDASLHPGYIFNEAWSVGRASSNTQDVVEVSSYKCSFYASLTQTTYTIKYMVDVGDGFAKDMTKYAQNQGMVTNYKYGEAHTVALWNCQDYLYSGLSFGGWYIQGDSQYNVYYTLDERQYGDIVLVARVY